MILKKKVRTQKSCFEKDTNVTNVIADSGKKITKLTISHLSLSVSITSIQIFLTLRIRTLDINEFSKILIQTTSYDRATLRIIIFFKAIHKRLSIMIFVGVNT